MSQLLFRVLAGALLPLIFSGCGGGGGGSDDTSSTGTPPHISNLVLSRTFVPFMEGGGTSTIQTTLNYSDPESDIVSIEIRVSDGSSLSIPVPSPLPAPTGTLTALIQFSTTKLGHYTANLWAVDAQGHVSDTLTTPTVTIAVDTGNWTSRTSPVTSRLNDVVWNGSRFVSVGDGGTILISTDGISWTQESSGVSNQLTAVIWNGSRFLTVGGNATLLTSPDGVNWTPVSLGITGDLQAIAWSGTTYVAGGLRSGDPLLLWSSDAQTWHEISPTVGSSRYVYDLAWSGTNFVATTVLNNFPQTASVLTSPDGLSWSEVPVSATSLSSFSIRWIGDQFVAGATNGNVLRSPDGVNWQVQNTGSSANLWAVGWNGLNLIAAGNTGLVGSLDGGQAWQTVNVPTGIVSLAWGNRRFVGVGSSGEIYTAP